MPRRTNGGVSEFYPLDDSGGQLLIDFLLNKKIECVFADAKEKYGMRYTLYRGLKVNCEKNPSFA